MATINLFTDTDALSSTKKTKITKTVNLLEQTFPNVTPAPKTNYTKTIDANPIVTAPQTKKTEPKSLFSTIADFVTTKLNSITVGGISSGIQRVKQTPAKEYFLPTSTQGQPAVKYVADTVKSAVKTIKGAGKLTPAYTLYRAVTGKPVTAKEYLTNIIDSGLEGLNTAWRVQPAAPTVGAGMSLLKTLRQKAQGKVTWDDVVNAPIQGINEQPGVGEVFTDNAKWARAIDIAFLGTMVVKPLASKTLKSLNLKAEEINKMKSVLGVEPTATMKEVSNAFKKKMKSIPDAFTNSPSSENMAIRKQLTDAYNILKKSNVIEQKYAEAYNFILNKLGIKIETPTVEKKPKQLTDGQYATPTEAKVGNEVTATNRQTNETVTGTIVNRQKTGTTEVAVIKTKDNGIKLVPINKYTEISTPVPEQKKPTVLEEYVDNGTEQQMQKAISTYISDEGVYKKPDGTIEQTPALKELTTIANTPSGKRITQSKVTNAIRKGEIKLNKDNSITVYRVGTPRSDRLLSVSYDKPSAEQFAQQASVTGTERPINEMKIMPQDIKAYIGGTEKELLIQMKTPQGKTPSKIARSIEQKAIEQSLTTGFEGIAGYDKITIKDQAEKASVLLKDIEKTRRVIKGEEPLPAGLRGSAVIKAVEDYIKETGDGKLAYELANSPLVSETSSAAQELRLAAEREPDSLTLKLQQLKKLRQDAIKKKTGKTVDKAVKEEVENIKKEAKKKAPTKEDWGSFIRSIQC